MQAAAAEIMLSTKPRTQKIAVIFRSQGRFFLHLRWTLLSPRKTRQRGWSVTQSYIPTCQAISDEAIVQDISHAANELHMPRDACSCRSPDSDKILIVLPLHHGYPI